MKQASWGFLAGMVFMAALVMVEIWGLTPRIDTGTEYGTASFSTCATARRRRCFSGRASLNQSSGRSGAHTNAPAATGGRSSSKSEIGQRSAIAFAANGPAILRRPRTPFAPTAVQITADRQSRCPPCSPRLP